MRVWRTEQRGCRVALLLLFAAVNYAGRAIAQVQPDAGRIQEQLRAPEPPRKPAAPQIRVEPPPGPTKVETPPFFVSRFRVTGSTLYPPQVLADWLGEPQRPMTLLEVQATAERITQLYKDLGYIVARALVPAQDIRDGVVEIRVVEGRYERIDISNASDMSESRIRAFLGDVREETLVHGPTLERSVLLMSDLAGIQPKATLEPAAQAGYTNLLLEIAPAKSTDYDVSIDNGGSRFTGRTRVSLGATANSPLNIGDRLSARVVSSGRLLNSYRLAYDAPLGETGGRANGFLSYTSYQLGGQFAALEASGAAASYGVAVAYPWVRSSDFTLRAQLGLETRRLTDRIGSLDILNEKSAQVLQWGGGGDMRDGFLGGGITAFQALASNGLLSIKTPSLRESDAATARTRGQYRKLVVALNRLQALGEDMRLGINYTAQQASDNLDSSEKFSVGGLSGVRAYPPGEAAGDDVHLVQAELKYNAGPALGGQLVPSLFLDYASSRLNHEPWEGFAGKNHRKLAGGGIGLEWSRPGQMFARGWYAHKIGSEVATADTERRARVWVQAGLLF